jgi:hypothetical protein
MRMEFSKLPELDPERRRKIATYFGVFVCMREFGRHHARRDDDTLLVGLTKAIDSLELELRTTVDDTENSSELALLLCRQAYDNPAGLKGSVSDALIPRKDERAFSPTDYDAFRPAFELCDMGLADCSDNMEFSLTDGVSEAMDLMVDYFNDKPNSTPDIISDAIDTARFVVEEKGAWIVSESDYAADIGEELADAIRHVHHDVEFYVGLYDERPTETLENGFTG